jgi:hypothetical protein
MEEDRTLLDETAGSIRQKEMTGCEQNKSGGASSNPAALFSRLSM